MEQEEKKSKKKMIFIILVVIIILVLAGYFFRDNIYQITHNVTRTNCIWEGKNVHFYNEKNPIPDSAGAIYDSSGNIVGTCGGLTGGCFTNDMRKELNLENCK